MMKPCCSTLRNVPSALVLLAVVFGFVTAFAGTASAQTVNTLYSFTGTPDGADPFGGLVADSKGNFYGTTQHGGLSNNGTVFELSPPATAGGAWVETVIWSFAGGSDGQNPSYTMVLDKGGNLYGETQRGGQSCGCGTVFKLKPPAVAGGAWSKRVMHAFSTAEGILPYGGLVIDSKGAVYGITFGGGALGYGAAFKVAPAGSGFSETTLYSFGAGGDSNMPYGPLTLDSAGALYGAAIFGGTNNLGTVFKLSPPVSGGVWTNSILYSFDFGKPGCYPQGNLILDKGGKLYGTATACGALGYGTFFRLSPPAIAGGSWTESPLGAFDGSNGGGYYPSLFLDQKTSIFYGTSFFYGGAFKLVPPAVAGGAWTDAVFPSVGGHSLGPMVEDANGVLYGTTYGGGTNNLYGAIFSITP